MTSLSYYNENDPFAEEKIRKQELRDNVRVPIERFVGESGDQADYTPWFEYEVKRDLS